MNKPTHSNIDLLQKLLAPYYERKPALLKLSSEAAKHKDPNHTALSEADIHAGKDRPKSFDTIISEIRELAPEVVEKWLSQIEAVEESVDATETPAEPLSPVAADPEQLSNLERQLRNHLKSENTPKQLADINSYSLTLDTLIEDIQRLSPKHQEATKASNKQATTTRRLRNYWQEIEESKQRVDKAFEQKGLKQLKEEANIIQRYLSDIAGTQWRAEPSFRWADGLYQDLVIALYNEAVQTLKKAEEHRQEVSIEARQHITVANQDNVAGYTEALEDLYQKQRAGWLHVEIASSNEEVEIETVIKHYTEQLRRICTTETERLLKEAEEDLAAHDLAGAENRYKTAKEFIQNEYLSKTDPSVESGRNELAKVASAIEEQRKKHKQATALFDNIKDADVEFPERVLQTIETINNLNPAEAGLGVVKKQWLTILRNHLRLLVDNAQRDTVEQCRGRLYSAAVLTIVTARQAFEKKAVQKLDEPEIKSEHDRLNALEEKVLAEQRLWNEFKTKYDEIQNRLEQSQIQPQELPGIRQEFAPEEQKTFSPEWNKLDTALTELADDQEKLATARERFNNNPLDSDLPQLLSGIAAQSQSYSEAQDLLHHHFALVALGQVETRITDGTLLKELAGDWQETNTRHLNTATQEAQQISTPVLQSDLLAQVENLRKVVTQLSNLRRQMAQRNYKQYLDDIDVRLQSEETERLLLRGLKQLRVHVGQTWRAECMAQIEQQVAQDATREYILLEQADAQGLKWASERLKELEAKRCLTEDGDGLLAVAVHRYYQEIRIAVMLGIEWRELTVAALTPIRFKEIEETNEPDWIEVLKALDEANQYQPGQTTLVSNELVSQIQQASLIYGAFFLPQQEAIPILEKERAKSRRQKSDPFICIALTWRYLDNIQTGLTLTKTLIADLEQEASPRTINLRNCLGAICGAHEEWQKGRHDKALQALGTVPQLAAKLIASIADPINQAVAQRREDWKREYAQSIRAEVEKNIPTIGGNPPGEYKALQMAEKILVINEWSGSPVDDLLRQIEPSLRIEIRLLSNELEDFLDNQQFNRVKDALDKANNLQKMATVAGKLQEGHAWIMAGNEAADFEDSLPSLKKLIEDFELLANHLNRWRQQLCKLLGIGDGRYVSWVWVWNRERNRTPLKELAEVQKSIERVEEDYFNANELPEEIEDIKQFVTAIKITVDDIALRFEDLHSQFRSDQENSQTSFDELRDRLINLAAEIERRRFALEVLKPAALGVLANDTDSINLEQHTIMRDNTGKPGRNQGGFQSAPHPEDMKTTKAVIQRVEDRKQNWYMWRKWRESACETLEQLHQNLHTAEDELENAGLSEANKACIETERQIKLLETQIKAIPGHPFCRAAMAEARKLPDHIDPNELGVVGWRELETIVETRLGQKWTECANQELATVRERLGDDRKPDTSLYRIIKEKSVQLDSLLKQIEKDIQKYEQSQPSRLGKRQPPRPMTQDIAKELREELEKARAIDRNDKRIDELDARIEKCVNRKG